MGNGQESREICWTESPVPFSDVGRNRSGGANRLIGESEPLRGREFSYELFYSIGKVHPALPDEEFAMSSDRGRHAPWYFAELSTP